jgi:hypothetical protein
MEGKSGDGRAPMADKIRCAEVPRQEAVSVRPGEGRVNAWKALKTRAEIFAAIHDGAAFCVEIMIK